MTRDTTLRSTEDLLCFPEDGIDRELIRGRLRERVALRDRRAGRALATLSYFICNWLDRLPPPHGEILTRAPGVRLRTNPDTTIWADLPYLPADLTRKLPEDACVIEGVPLLVVEVLSRRDSTRGLPEKVSDCLDAGVKLVWVADTTAQSVTAYSADGPPVLLSDHDVLSGGQALPGFGVPAGAVFA